MEFEAQHLPRNKCPNLFQSDEVLSVKLVAPFVSISNEERTKDDAQNGEEKFRGLPARLVVSQGQQEVDIPVLLRSRGNTSKTECGFRKLTMHFPKESRKKAEGTVFEGIKNVKIGTHCPTNPSLGEGGLVDRPFVIFGRLKDEKATWREALIYKIFESILPDHFKTRYAKVTYVNEDAVSDPDKVKSFDISEPRKAFFLETTGSLVDRYGKDEFDEVPQHQTDSGAAKDNVQYDVANADLMLAAQMIFQNFDWAVDSGNVTLRTNGHNLWNVEGLVKKSSAAGAIPAGTLIPYDFDLDDFVASDTPLNSLTLSSGFLGHLPSVTRQFAARFLNTMPRGSQSTPKSLSAAAGAILQKKSAIESAIAASPADDVMKANLTMALAGVSGFLEQKLHEAAVFVVEDVPLLNDAGETLCELGRNAPFVIKEEKKDKVKILLASPLGYQECIPNFDPFGLQEAEGWVSKSSLSGTTIPATLSDKILAENFRKARQSKTINVLFYNSNFDKVAKIKLLGGKATCAVEAGGGVAVEIDEAEFGKSNGKGAVLFEGLDTEPTKCKAFKKGVKIDLDLNIFQPAG